MSAMLKARLLGIMQREVKSQNLQLSMYGMQRLELLVGQGIQRMRLNSAADHAGYAIQAERNLKQLIRHFGDYSRNLGTHPQLSDADFDAALVACPNVWPYRSSS
jgi:hypothetical protein